MNSQDSHLEFAVSVIEMTRKDVGLVVYSDEQTTWIAAVSEGAVVAFEQYDFGGDAVTAYLAQTMQDRGLRLTIDADKAVVEEIKQQLCYVALDFKAELESSRMTSSKDKSYQMPAGETITIGSERFLAPESIFKPSLRGLGDPGLHEAAYKTIMQCEVGLWNNLLGNMVLAGSNVRFSGLKERFVFEIERLVPQPKKRFVKAYGFTPAQSGRRGR